MKKNIERKEASSLKIAGKFWWFSYLILLFVYFTFDRVCFGYLLSSSLLDNILHFLGFLGNWNLTPFIIIGYIIIMVIATLKTKKHTIVKRKQLIPIILSLFIHFTILSIITWLSTYTPSQFHVILIVETIFFTLFAATMFISISEE